MYVEALLKFWAERPSDVFEPQMFELMVMHEVDTACDMVERHLLESNMLQPALDAAMACSSVRIVRSLISRGVRTIWSEVSQQMLDHHGLRAHCG